MDEILTETGYVLQMKYVAAEKTPAMGQEMNKAEGTQDALACSDSGCPCHQPESGTTEAPTNPQTAYAAVMTMNCGCVTHCLALGVTVGMQTEYASAVMLLLVIMLCQLLEGICLSHLIASLTSRTVKLVLCTLTVGSMPLGIILGLVISLSVGGGTARDSS